MATSISRIIVHRVPLQLRTPFTTSFGTYETLDRPFVVIETSDGLRGVGEIPTLLDPAYKAEVDTPAVLTSLVSSSCRASRAFSESGIRLTRSRPFGRAMLG